MCVSTAREWIRIGKALRTLPAVDEAFASQQLSYAKVRAVTRVAQPETEVELVDLARSVPAGRLGHALAAWTQRHEDHDERTARHERDKSFRHRVEADGMVSFNIRLAPEDVTAALAAVEATMMRRSRETKPQEVVVPAAECGDRASAGASNSLAQQRVDAFVELVTNGGANIDATDDATPEVAEPTSQSETRAGACEPGHAPAQRTGEAKIR